MSIFPASISPSGRIIDSHQHVCWHRRDARGLVADLDAHGIERAWLLTWLIGPAEECPEQHQYLDPILQHSNDTNPGVTLGQVMAAVRAYPERFIPGFCPDPTWKKAPQLLEVAHAMHGVRACGEWKFRVLLDDPRCLEIFRVAGRLRMPVVLHLDVPYLCGSDGRQVYQPRWYGGTVDNLERALEACPETMFIGHAPGFWREISRDACRDPKMYPDGPVVSGGRLDALFEAHGNLCADLSAGSGLGALRRDPDHAVAFLTRHADRLLFARDCYGTDLHAFLGSLSLPADVIEKVYWRNAERLIDAASS